MIKRQYFLSMALLDLDGRVRSQRWLCFYKRSWFAPDNGEIINTEIKNYHDRLSCEYGIDGDIERIHVTGFNRV